MPRAATAGQDSCRRLEEGRGRVHRRMKEPMKESGLPDLKARRDAHMAPTTGHPMSPGGSRARLAAPREASLAHPCALRTTVSITTTNTAAIAAHRPGPTMLSRPDGRRAQGRGTLKVAMVTGECVAVVSGDQNGLCSSLGLCMGRRWQPCIYRSLVAICVHRLNKNGGNPDK